MDAVMVSEKQQLLLACREGARRINTLTTHISLFVCLLMLPLVEPNWHPDSNDFVDESCLPGQGTECRDGLPGRNKGKGSYQHTRSPCSGWLSLIFLPGMGEGGAEARRLVLCLHHSPLAGVYSQWGLSALGLHRLFGGLRSTFISHLQEAESIS